MSPSSVPTAAFLSSSPAIIALQRMLSRIVSRASRRVASRRVARTSPKAAAPKFQRRFVRTEGETVHPVIPEDLTTLSPATFTQVTGIPEEQITRRVYIYRPMRNAMQSGSAVRGSGESFLFIFTCCAVSHCFYQIGGICSSPFR